MLSRAEQFSASGIAAVELDPQVIELVQQRYGEFSGRPYSAPGVRAHVAEARGFVAGSGERLDHTDPRFADLKETIVRHDDKRVDSLAQRAFGVDGNRVAGVKTGIDGGFQIGKAGAGHEAGSIYTGR